MGGRVSENESERERTETCNQVGSFLLKESFTGTDSVADGPSPAVRGSRAAAAAAAAAAVQDGAEYVIMGVAE